MNSIKPLIVVYTEPWEESDRGDYEVWLDKLSEETDEDD